MTLRLGLEIDKTLLLVGESARCQVTLTNTGEDGTRVTHPWFSRRAPLFRIVDRSTGLVRLPYKAGERPDPTVVLPGGKSLRATYALEDEIPGLAPGEYDISVLLNAVESEPVRVRIQPSTPRLLSLDTLQGIVAYGAWLDGARLVRGKISTGPRTAEDVAVLAEADLRERPVVSLPVNRSDRRHQWVAWSDKTAVQAVQFSPGLGPSPVVRVPLPDPEITFASPLFVERCPGPGRRPAASGLAWCGGHLRILLIAERGEGWGKTLEFARPHWMSSHTTTSGKRRASIVSPRGEAVKLETVGWDDKAIGAPETRESWTGRFVAAGATLSLKDVLHGAILLVKEAKPVPIYELIEWEIDVRNQFRETKRSEVRWAGAEPLRAEVRVGAQGSSALLLFDRKGKTHLACGGVSRELPATMPPALDLLFPGTAPVIVCAEPGAGLRTYRPDGKPLRIPRFA